MCIILNVEIREHQISTSAGAGTVHQNSSGIGAGTGCITTPANLDKYGYDAGVL